MSKKAARLAVLENQVQRLKKRVDQLKQRSDRYAWTRLAIFVAGIALSLVAFYFVGGWLGWPGLVVTLVVFNVVAYYHRKLSDSLTRHEIWLKLKSTEIARMKLDWNHIPSAAPSLSNPEHSFETDLDLTGPRSLYQLLDTAITREGSQRLRDWLLATAPDLPVIRRRQALIRELAPLSLFRDKLILRATLASRDLDEQWEGKKLLAWLLKKSATRSLLPLVIGLAALSLFNITLFILSRFGLAPNIWVITLLVYVAISSFNSSKVSDLFGDAFALRDGLRKLSAVLQYLETYNYGNHANLKKLCEPILNREERPSVQLRKIARVAAGAAIQRSQLFGFLINLVIPWDFYFTHRLNVSKARIAKYLPGWLEVWFELEALSSLAAFTYLNPDYTFPEIEDKNSTADKSITFQARELGHPLIPDEQKVCNDFALDELGEIIIITGSNMAGKSSFLRTLGVNLRLAYSGSPVNAAYLNTSLFRLFSCIRVNDSVTEGYSYFYAEVRRLKALLDELERPADMPLFFLIDEIFRGTNNRERLIGSRAYLRALLNRNGVGIVSTHDLELVRLADESTRIRNYHFREEVIEGQMAFDYKLRPGPCPTTNALKIMRLAGLPIEG